MTEDSLSLVYKFAPVPAVDQTDFGGLSGYASTFNFLDYHNDIIAPGAYKADIPRFLNKGFIGGVGHDHNNPIGKPVELFEDSKGLFLVAQFVDTSKAQEDRKLISSGVVKELSVGILPLQVKRLSSKKQVQEYWASVGHNPTEEELMRAENGARIVKRAKLLEVSPVALAANEQSEILSYKAGRKLSKTSVEILNQVCQQIKISYELLESLLEEAGMKAEDDVAEAVDAEATQSSEPDPTMELLEAFRQFLASKE